MAPVKNGVFTDFSAWCVPLISALVFSTSITIVTFLDAFTSDILLVSLESPEPLRFDRSKVAFFCSFYSSLVCLLA